MHSPPYHPQQPALARPFCTVPRLHAWVLACLVPTWDNKSADFTLFPLSRACGVRSAYGHTCNSSRRSESPSSSPIRKSWVVTWWPKPTNFCQMVCLSNLPLLGGGLGIVLCICSASHNCLVYTTLLPVHVHVIDVSELFCYIPNTLDRVRESWFSIFWRVSQLEEKEKNMQKLHMYKVYMAFHCCTFFFTTWRSEAPETRISVV